MQQGDAVFTPGECTLVISDDVDAFEAEVEGQVIDAGPFPVYGESAFATGAEEAYRVIARRNTIALRLDPEEYAWIGEVPLFKLRLRQLAEQRAIHVERARRLS